jgi:predicted nuclease of predicted toxin-antitoxin system
LRLLKLLIDENLAPRLAADLADLFPESVHVNVVNLGSAPDAVIWEYAKMRGFVFLTKDKDFAALSVARNQPPKVILLQIGNCSTEAVSGIVRRNAVRFSDFEKDNTRNLLVLK